MTVICCACGGRLLHGKPLGDCKISEWTSSGVKSYVQHYCDECAERHMRDLCEGDEDSRFVPTIILRDKARTPS